MCAMVSYGLRKNVKGLTRRYKGTSVNGYWSPMRRAAIYQGIAFDFSNANEALYLNL